LNTDKEMTTMVGKVVFVGAGPGDCELITIKGLRALQRADVICYDSLIDRSLLDGLKAQQLMYVGKRRGKHSMPQEEISQLLVEQAKLGKIVVRLKGGDCSVLGRLAEELLVLVENDIAYEIIPGVTSATAAPVFAGIPVTHRGMADSFAIVTAHRGLDGQRISIPSYNESTTVVLMMALGTAEIWQAELKVQGYPDDLPLACVSAGGTKRQKVLITTVGRAVEDIAKADLPTPGLAVVGRVVTLHKKLDWFYGPTEDSNCEYEFYGE